MGESRSRARSRSRSRGRRDEKQRSRSNSRNRRRHGESRRDRSHSERRSGDFNTRKDRHNDYRRHSSRMDHHSGHANKYKVEKSSIKGFETMSASEKRKALMELQLNTASKQDSFESQQLKNRSRKAEKQDAFNFERTAKFTDRSISHQAFEEDELQLQGQLAGIEASHSEAIFGKTHTRTPVSSTPQAHTTTSLDVIRAKLSKNGDSQTKSSESDEFAPQVVLNLPDSAPNEKPVLSKDPQSLLGGLGSAVFARQQSSSETQAVESATPNSFAARRKILLQMKALQKGSSK